MVASPAPAAKGTAALISSVLRRCEDRDMCPACRGWVTHWRWACRELAASAGRATAGRCRAPPVSSDPRDEEKLMAGWTTGDVPDQSGRTALVTGGNSGLGYQDRKSTRLNSSHVKISY